ncbi:MAG: M48 family metallopeptidase [Eubacteriales bacterium]|nr:M48 family metallopeptidase [Eubacteriales bacterium]
MEEISVTIRRSRRRTLSVEVQKDGSVIVRAPRKARQEVIRDFLEVRKEWIASARHRVLQEREQLAAVVPLDETEVEALKERAREAVTARAAYYAAQLGVDYGRIAIRRQKTRWGSCSAKGNLNFNCLLALAPQKVLDYVVIHELCHRLEMNHSDAFWAHVEKMMPDYKAQRAWLKENGDALMAKIYPVT